MEKRLRLFHFSKDQYGESHYFSSIIFDDSYAEFGKIVEDLDSRINKCIDDKYAKNFRFKRPSSQIVTNVSEIFENKENFDRHSKDIASKFQEAIGRRFQNDFYLVVLTTEINSREILFIVKMETGTAIQVTDEDTLTTLDKILPDKKSRLQKATVIYKDKTIQFKNNEEEPDSERTNIHSRVLDRTDDNISGYFFTKFLDSDNVIDDKDSAAKAAIEAIKNVSRPYLKCSYKEEHVIAKLQNYLSNERNTSFTNLIEEIQPLLLDFENEDIDMDIERLAEEAYHNAKERNNTVLYTFMAELKTPPRTVFVSSRNNKELEIKVFNTLLDQGEVFVEENDEYTCIKIKKPRITLIER